MKVTQLHTLINTVTQEILGETGLVQEDLRTVDDIASAIGYQKIWEAINTYVKDSKTDLASSENDIDSLVETVTKMLNGANHDKRLENNPDTEDGWFFV